MAKMNPVVHFELPAENQEELSEFYAEVFGWEKQAMGQDTSGYIVLTTTESDPQTGRPKNPGSINGGMYKKDPTKEEHPSFVIAVDDINEYIEKIKKAGGKIVNGPSDIPGVGKYASFTDPQGNRLSVLQPFPQMENVHGNK